MKIFKDYTFAWWQMSVLKLAVFSIGLGVGAYCSTWVLANINWVITVAVISTTYAVYAAFCQKD